MIYALMLIKMMIKKIDYFILKELVFYYYKRVFLRLKMFLLNWDFHF